MGLFDVTWSLQVEKLLPPVLRNRTFSVEDDDFKSGDPDNSYIEFALKSGPGHWKEFPLVGINIYKYLQGTQSPQALQRDIQLGLRNIGITKPSIDLRSYPTIKINNVIVQLNGV